MQDNHKEDPSSLFSQSHQNQPNNYESVIKQAVNEKVIDFIKHKIKNVSDLLKHKFVLDKLDIKTLEYIYQLEKKYFKLSPDALKYRLSVYRPENNYTLSIDKSQDYKQ